MEEGEDEHLDFFNFFINEVEEEEDGHFNDFSINEFDLHFSTRKKTIDISHFVRWVFAPLPFNQAI